MSPTEIAALAAHVRELHDESAAVVETAAHQLEGKVALERTWSPTLTSVRCLLLPAGAFVASALVLEADLAPRLDDAIPLFLAAWAQLHRPVPRDTAVRGFVENPSFVSLIARDPLAERRIGFSRLVRPTSHLRALVLRAWPLLALTDDAQIESRIARRVRRWLGP